MPRRASRRRCPSAPPPCCRSSPCGRAPGDTRIPGCISCADSGTNLSLDHVLPPMFPAQPLALYHDAAGSAVIQSIMMLCLLQRGRRRSGGRLPCQRGHPAGGRYLPGAAWGRCHPRGARRLHQARQAHGAPPCHPQLNRTCRHPHASARVVRLRRPRALFDHLFTHYNPPMCLSGNRLAVAVQTGSIRSRAAVQLE